MSIILPNLYHSFISPVPVPVAVLVPDPDFLVFHTPSSPCLFTRQQAFLLLAR